ncbi:toprim domain-containing protein [Micromonospora sp. STR1s_5]|nr:toprim domain-containing protein [Micromonospora sp. STR1s_5]
MGDDGQIVRVPAMVAAMRHVQTGEIVGIHRTVIALNGSAKIARRGLGSLRHAAIMLDRAGDDPAELTVAEGIETGIAARMLGFKRVWALYSTSNVRSLPVLPAVRRLTLLEENDANGASAKACAVCAERWDSAGVEVSIVRPRAGLSDLNDVILKERAQ